MKLEERPERVSLFVTVCPHVGAVVDMSVCEFERSCTILLASGTDQSMEKGSLSIRIYECCSSCMFLQINIEWNDDMYGKFGT